MTTDSARWERVQSLFHQVLELPKPDRGPFLERACADAPELAREVLTLVEEDARANPLLDGDLAVLADELLDSSASVPSRIGPYRLLRVLGEGGMGVVYLAEREDLGQRVAIKTLRDAALSPARRERFATEQRALARLNHPLVARLYDADVLPEGIPYFVMEYVEGVPLNEYCASRGLAIEERLRLFLTVCEAVQAAHRLAIIHRDVKPSNVLVTEAGEVKLLDFGIAKQLEGLAAPADQTRTGLRAMTPAYAAPEQVRGEPVGVYTDVYALGVVLYELLTGRLPFDLSRLTPRDAEAVILDREPERPSTRGRSRQVGVQEVGVVPGAERAGWNDLDVLCLTAMHKDPERRYATVDALRRDVEHYLEAQPLDARPDTFGYRLGKFLRRNRRSVALGTTAAAVLVSLVAFYTIRLAEARDAAVAEAARTQRIQRFTLNLFEGGDGATGPADSLRVISLLDRGVQQARLLANEPVVQAELFFTLGGIYQKLGNLGRADSLFQAALDQRQEVFGPEHAEVGESQVALGLLRVDQARMEEGEQLVREGYARLGLLLPPEHPAVARAATALGYVLQARGVQDSSIAVLDSVVRLQERLGRHDAEYAASLLQLANSRFYAEDYRISDSLNRVLLRLHGQLYGERHPLIAEGLTNLGASLTQRGFYDSAEAHYRRALDILETFHGPDHPRVASSLTMLGRSLMYQKKNDEAAGMLERALQVQERVYGPVHPAVASALNDLGNVAVGRGDYATAESAFRRMAEIYQAVHGGKHWLMGIALSNLANVHLLGGDYARSEPVFRQAIAIFTEAQGPRSMNTAIARLKLGRLYTRTGRFAEAERELLDGYAALSEQATPSVSWLVAARRDLVALYDSLGRADEAARWRAEMADTAATPTRR